MVCRTDFLLPVVLVFNEDMPESALAKWPCWSSTWWCCWCCPPCLCCSWWCSMGRPLISITRLVGRGLFGLDDASRATGPGRSPLSDEGIFASWAAAPLPSMFWLLLPPSLSLVGPLSLRLWSSSLLCRLPSLRITTPPLTSASSPILLFDFSSSRGLTDSLSSFSSFFSSSSLLSHTPELADSQSVASIGGPRPKSGG